MKPIQKSAPFSHLMAGLLWGDLRLGGECN